MVDRVQGLYHGIVLASRRTRFLVALLAGLIAALALPPLDLLPTLAVAFPVLVWSVDAVFQGELGTRNRLIQVWLVGWAFGLAYFTAGLWWLGAAFVTGGPQFIWLLPFGVLGLPAFLALFPAFGLCLAFLLWSRGAGRILALAFGLGVAENLRAWVLTGFPWNSFGQVFANHIVLAQAAAWIGASGLGLLALMVFATPATLATGRGRAGRWGPSTVAILVLAGMAGFGLLRLKPTGGQGVDFALLPVMPEIRLRIMQPNIPQDAKTFETLGPDLLRRYLELSDAARGAHATGIADVTHLFWPESPFPYVLERNQEALAAIGRFLPARTHLITGAIRAEETGQAQPRFRYFNAMQVLDKTGIIAGYDKVHLVPFGEYLPFEDWLRSIGLQQFVSVIGGFTASPERRPLAIPGLPAILPLICFEAIFPGEITLPPTGEAVMVVVTNDAWFGQTSGPHQHFAQARLRTIEFGLPLVRAANSGISAVVDPHGRILARIGLGIADVLDSPLPRGLASTVYRRYGERVSIAILFCLLLLSGLSRFRDRRDRLS
ncbi:MAG: apolipoprotein N-acyltransferase [Beijerinckiaceae bacterium]|nr:apolipoprotein N-acyltransferase [Beijerinckiaceae bacterium]